jgi:hypothetical protein
VPKREEVWQVDFGVTQKVRPALIISVPYGDKDRALIGVVPHTTATGVRSLKFASRRIFSMMAFSSFKESRPCRQSISCAVLAFLPPINFDRSKGRCCAGREFLPRKSEAFTSHPHRSLISQWRESPALKQTGEARPSTDNL